MSFFKNLKYYGKLGMKTANRVAGFGSKASGFLRSSSGRALLAGLDYMLPGLNASQNAGKFQNLNRSYQNLMGVINNPQQGDGRRNNYQGDYGRRNNNKDSIEKNRPKFSMPGERGNKYHENFFSNKAPPAHYQANYIGSMRQITDQKHGDRLPMNGSWSN